MPIYRYKKNTRQQKKVHVCNQNKNNLIRINSNIMQCIRRKEYKMKTKRKNNAQLFSEMKIHVHKLEPSEMMRYMQANDKVLVKSNEKYLECEIT